MIKRIHIFDFDGTLVDSSHRYRITDQGKIDLPYWIENEHKAMGDTVLPLAMTFRMLRASPFDYAVIATARIWDAVTREFVKANDLEADCVFARRDRSDTRGGAALKITGIKKLLNLKQFQAVDEFHVYEDNLSYMNDICDAFGATGHFFPSNQGH